MDDLKPLADDDDDGDSSPPGGMSEMAAKIRRMLTERAGLKLNDLFLFLEKIFDEFERMR